MNGGSGPEESASPQSDDDKQGKHEVEVGRCSPGGTPHAGLDIPDLVVTAISSTAGDVDMSQVEGFSHVEALTPRGGRAASDYVAWVPQLIRACGFQALIHGTSAGNQGGLFRGTPVGAVPLTAVTLEFILWQVFKLQDWTAVAFGGIAAPQEVEGLVVVEASGTWAARKVTTTTGVALVS